MPDLDLSRICFQAVVHDPFQAIPVKFGKNAMEDGKAWPVGSGIHAQLIKCLSCFVRVPVQLGRITAFTELFFPKMNRNGPEAAENFSDGKSVVDLRHDELTSVAGRKLREDGIGQLLG